MVGLFNEELIENGVGVCGLILSNYPYIFLERFRRSIKTCMRMASAMAEL
jgi:hypothetical protein